MKKTILLFAALIFAGFSYAQSNNGFNYKALLTDNGEAVANALINVKATFYNASNEIKWQEEHSGINTDENGIFTINLGEGTRLDGVAEFSDIYWGNEGISLSVEVDNGSGYTLLIDKEPLKSVPYTQSASIANTVQNSYFRTSLTDGSIRFYDPNGGLLGSKRSYIKQTGESLEIGKTPVFTTETDSPYMKVNEDAVWISGKLTTVDSGDSDMKAYLYGYVDDVGEFEPSNSSAEVDTDGNIIYGFKAERTNTGIYKITLKTKI